MTAIVAIPGSASGSILRAASTTLLSRVRKNGFIAISSPSKLGMVISPAFLNRSISLARAFNAVFSGSTSSAKMLLACVYSCAQ